MIMSYKKKINDTFHTEPQKQQTIWNEFLGVITDSTSCFKQAILILNLSLLIWLMGLSPAPVLWYERTEQTVRFSTFWAQYTLTEQSSSLHILRSHIKQVTAPKHADI